MTHITLEEVHQAYEQAKLCWGITPKNVGAFHPQQKEFLA
jgi:hypothetical protein